MWRLHDAACMLDACACRDFEEAAVQVAGALQRSSSLHADADAGSAVSPKCQDSSSNTGAGSRPGGVDAAGGAGQGSKRCGPAHVGVLAYSCCALPFTTASMAQAQLAHAAVSVHSQAAAWCGAAGGLASLHAAAPRWHGV